MERQGPWLRSAPFDRVLIGGVLALALLVGGVGLLRPSLFLAVVTLDLWLLAYPHVASMYTRLAFDRESRREHRFLLLGLPPIVFAATAGVAWAGGAIAINTLYFVWQTWHYTRQSYGISRAYERASGAPDDLTTSCVVYGFPLWGLLHRASQQPTTFFGSPLFTVAVPRAVVLAAGLFALGSLGLWTYRRLAARESGGARGSLGHTLFVLSHVLVTLVSYVAVRDVTEGWLFINVWHNAQYILFVWAFNARRFARGVDPAQPFLSRLAQPRNVVRYALVCLGLATAFYAALGGVTAAMTWKVLPLVLVTHQAVNFHHYIVDAIIWRRRQSARDALQGRQSSPKLKSTSPLATTARTSEGT